MSDTTTVYTARWQRAQAVMERLGLGLLLIGPGADLFYLLGTPGHASPRLVLFALPRQGRPTLLVPELEAPGFLAWQAALDLLTWRDGEEPLQVLRRVVAPVSIRAAAVGDRLWSVFLLRLQETYRGATWSAAGAVLRELRMIKDGHELAIMREASRRTDEVWQQFCQQPVAGLTERQAAQRLTDLLAERAMPPSFPAIVGAAEHGASPHHTGSDRPIRPGDALVCDFGGILDGYCSDITRTVVIGEPSDEFRRVYELVQRAQEAAFQAIRPGVTAESVDAAARSVIEAGGYGPRFIHRTGHGIGIDIHEEPYLVAGNRLRLQPGMVFSDEPGIYLTDRFGVRIEDLVVVTEQGAERLNAVSRALTVMA
jgi:Xaa-Pro aminopeptidase